MSDFALGDKVRRRPLGYVDEYAAAEVGTVVELHEHWVEVCWTTHRGRCGAWCADRSCVMRSALVLSSDS